MALSSCWGCYGPQAAEGTFPRPFPPTRRFGRPRCPRDVGPPCEAVVQLCAIRRRRQEVAAGTAIVGPGSIRCPKALGMSRGLAALHALGARPRGPLGVLPAVLEGAPLALRPPGQARALGR